MNADETRIAVLRASKLAQDLDERECAELAGIVDVRNLSDGEILVREGATDSHLYVVSRGLVGVVKYIETDTRLTVATLQAGDLAGEMGFVDDTSYHSSLVALGGAQVLALGRDKLESLLESHPQVVYHVMRGIIRTVHATQRRLSHQAVELSNYIYKQHGRY
jgi:CRP-like cAMP-binding protein